MINKKIVGIDLGTTNSVISILEGGNPIIIINSEGTRTTPSIVSFNKQGEILVGNLAKRQIILNSENTFYSVKRLIGLKYKEIIKEIKFLPYKINEDKNGNIKLYSSNFKKEFSPEEISSFILKNLILDANRYLKDDIKDAVITVPAYFNDSQRIATKDAATIAGINLVKIINEPTAAALAYGFMNKVKEIVLIFDLGGGTFDISLLEIGKDFIEVLATTGDNHLGGDDIDQILVKYIIDTFEKQESINLSNDKQTLQRIIEAAEKAKIELSLLQSVNINIPYVGIKNGTPLHLDIIITRKKFEELIYPLVKKCEKPLLQAIADAKISIEQIDQVILVGGSTRIPLVQDLLIKLVKKPLNEKVNPDEVVAMGAAVEASIIGGEITDIVLFDVAPLSLGVETEHGIMTTMIQRNTRLPTKSVETFSTAVNNQDSVTINILQGERLLAKDNKSLGMFILDRIPKAPRGIPQIEVSFQIDSNGLLSVSAKEKTTGINQTIKIENSSLLDRDEIEKIIKDSENYSKIDKKIKFIIKSFNLFDKFLNNCEYILKKEYNKNISYKTYNYLFILINKLKKSYNNKNLSELLINLKDFKKLYKIILKNYL